MPELEREVMIDAKPETIFPLLVDPDGMTRWMGTEATVEAEPGGTFRVLVAGEHPAVGEFVEIVPNEKVVFTWGWDAEGNPITPGSTTVEIGLHPEGDKTLVRLTHRDLPDENAVREHTHGWDHYLARLATAAAGGDAGPDEGPGI